MRVLILTASYGSGHNAAAQSLSAAFAAAGVSVTVVDHFRDLVHPAFDRVSRGLYAAILRRAPMVWGLAYGIGDRLSSDSRWAFGMPCLGASRLGQLLDTMKPDAVVSVHATPTVALSTLAREGRRIPPHTTVVTDFVAHNQWIAPGVDRYCVAAQEVKHEFVARGIVPDRVVVTGVPVRAGFETPLDQPAGRRALGRLRVGRSRDDAGRHVARPRPRAPDRSHLRRRPRSSVDAAHRRSARVAQRPLDVLPRRPTRPRTSPRGAGDQRSRSRDR